MRQQPARYNQAMPVFDEKQTKLEHYETMMACTGQLAVKHGHDHRRHGAGRSKRGLLPEPRWPGRPFRTSTVMKGLTDAKEMIQSVMVS